MKAPFRSFALPLVLLCLGIAPACGRKPPEAVSVDRAASQAKSVFAGAKGEVKDGAGEVTAALDRADYGGALKNIESLSMRPDLDREQREALAAAQISAMVKLQEKAAAGDKEASEVLENHRARK